MSKWLKQGIPVDRGPWTGCLRVRWRPARGAALVTGYLPGDQPKLKEAYDDYESRCWSKLQVAEAPEVHFRDQLDKFLGRRASKADAVVQEVEPHAAATMTLREWLGPDRDHPGPFWTCTGPKGSQRIDSYWQLLKRLGAPLADRPISTLKSNHFVEWFEEQMACASCVARAIEAGRTPGADIDWHQLVPRFDLPEFDGQRCEDHRTRVKLSTFDAARVRLRTMFAAALSDAAIEQYGRSLVTYNPVPRKDALLDPRSIIFLESDGEELRYGLSEAQVRLQTEASPPRYRAIPFVAAFTLNRGGQELAGMNIGDFSWVVVDGDRVGCIKLQNFYRRRRGGGHSMSKFGKTASTRRTIFLPTEPAQLAEDHILKFRSTPNPTACAACRDGVGHWGGPLRNDHDRNPHVDCDFAADAPLWVDEKGKRLDPNWYVRKVWHPMCEKAGLTQATLGWKPQLKHSRSTGTTLHLEHGTDREEVRRLGGWKSLKMIEDHYDRQRHSSRAKHVASWSGVAAGEGLEFQNRRLQQEVERLRARLTAAGIDPDSQLEAVIVPKRSSKLGDETKVLEKVVAVAADGGSPFAVLQALDVAAAAKNYKRLAETCADAGMPKLRSNDRQLPDGRKQDQLLEWHTVVATWNGARGALTDVV